eukprot:scaffold1280_cov246-Pinguiococcus_pyrenoidosus.AAC.2
MICTWKTALACSVRRSCASLGPEDDCSGEGCSGKDLPHVDLPVLTKIPILVPVPFLHQIETSRGDLLALPCHLALLRSPRS